MSYKQPDSCKDIFTTAFSSASLVVIFLNDGAYFSSFRIRVFRHACVLSHSILLFYQQISVEYLLFLFLFSLLDFLEENVYV